MINYTKNVYVDTSCQKMGVPKFPMCGALIDDFGAHSIGQAGKKDLQVMWLDLANAYGSVPHRLINYATEFFHMPERLRSLVSHYFKDLQGFITGLQCLAVGITMGCSISPVLFLAAFTISCLWQPNTH